ncbi:eukaryotic aspartyl protease family protein [Actinidia rufa]|uniref:Eukaryotic aspartyl protease family protein n=1 Tax=Actinidia rufa TaxID=165716 RepID=A0A7J0HB92_9ERIC|nr:eukaryotic aspartyl protease family protein [Actinidia rufa]
MQLFVFFQQLHCIADDKMSFADESRVGTESTRGNAGFHCGGVLGLLAFSALALPAAVVLCGFPAALTLERAFPTTSEGGLGLSQLRERDRVRHRRFLQSSSGVVDFPVEGTYDPYLVGLYFTRVQLGSPPTEFHVQIDTGSDVLWIPLNFFNPMNSETAKLISCSDQRCSLGAQSADSGCSTQNNQCSYTFQYGDGSGTSGYYVSDLMHLETVVGNTLTSNSSASIVFGCSTSQTGDLTKSDRAIDGIFGFGQQGLSVISQLSSQGITPKIFSHCLKGSNDGGGVLVLGEIVEPNIVYSPLVPSQPHYNLYLQSIAVNGQTLAIDPSVFATSSNRGTIVDSGTTLAYLAEEAYDPFVSAITAAVSQSVTPHLSKGIQCYLTTSSVSEIFPTVSLNFAGGASMFLKPEDYLLQQNSNGGAAVWCIGFQKIQGQGITILGGSSSISVSTATSNGKSEFVNAGQIGESSSSQNPPYKLIPIIITAFLLHFSARGSFPLSSH